MPMFSPARVKNREGLKEGVCVDTYLLIISQYVTHSNPPIFSVLSYDRESHGREPISESAVVAFAVSRAVFLCAKDRGEGSLGGKGSRQLGDRGAGWPHIAFHDIALGACILGKGKRILCVKCCGAS